MFASFSCTVVKCNCCNMWRCEARGLHIGTSTSISVWTYPLRTNHWIKSDGNSIGLKFLQVILHHQNSCYIFRIIRHHGHSYDWKFGHWMMHDRTTRHLYFLTLPYTAARESPTLTARREVGGGGTRWLRGRQVRGPVSWQPRESIRGGGGSPRAPLRGIEATWQQSRLADVCTFRSQFITNW